MHSPSSEGVVRDRKAKYFVRFSSRTICLCLGSSHVSSHVLPMSEATFIVVKRGEWHRYSEPQPLGLVQARLNLTDAWSLRTISRRTDTDSANALSSAHEARGLWWRPAIRTTSLTPDCASNQQAVSNAFSMVVFAPGARVIWPASKATRALDETRN